MILKRFIVSTLLVSLAAAPALAEEPMARALKAIPADALGFACIPSLEQLDADYRQALVDINVQDMVPPMAQSLLMSVRMVPMFMTLDTKQPVIIVAMPAKSLDELGKSVALIVPTSDPKPMLQGLMGQESDDGTWKVNAFGTPLIAAKAENKLVLASTAAIAKRVAGTEKGYDSRLTDDQRKFFENVDVAIWLEAQPIIAMFRPQIDGLIMMGLMSNMGERTMGESQAREQKSQIDSFLDGMAGVGVGLALDRGGLDLRFAMAAKPESELAANFAIESSGEPLLRGLPSPDFIFAAGQPADPAQTAKSVNDLDPLFAMLKSDTKFDSEKLERLRDLAKEWLVLFTGTRMSIYALDGSNGYVGATIIVDTTDAKRWMKLFLEMADLVDELLEAPEIEEDFRRFANAISIRSDAETVDGVDFAYWKFDIQKADDVEPDEWEKATKVLGTDGLLVRVGAVNDKTVVLTFGGGEAHATEVIAKARAGKDTISAPSGVADVDKHLPSEKSAAVYFALDRLLRIMKNVATALGDEANIPFEIPTVNAPIAIVGSSKEGWLRGDVFIPTKLGAAIGQAAKEVRAREEAQAKAASEGQNKGDDGGGDEDKE